MLRLLVPVLCLGLLAPAGRVQAQEAVAQPLTIEPSGEAYLRAVRLRQIDTDVGYFDPTAPPPPMTISEAPVRPPEEDDREWSSGERLPTILVAAAVLAGIAYVFARHGGNVSLSFRQEARNAGRRREATGAGRAAPEEERSRSLASILRIGDRREALVVLARNALARVIAESGVLLQSSWTARDALRHVPRDHRHMEALRELVLAGERVQFGGRDVTEDEFGAHVARIGPLFGRAAS